IRSKAGSGGVSRIWYRRSAFKRPASFSGSAVFIASPPDRLAALPPGVSVVARLSSLVSQCSFFRALRARSWFAFLRIIPRRLRDACYRFIAAIGTDGSDEVKPAQSDRLM